MVALRVEQRNEPKHSRKPKKSPVASVPAEPSDEASDLLSSANVDRTAQAVRLSNAVVNRMKPIVTPPETTAESVVSGLAINAMTATKFSQFAFGNVDLTACLAQLNGAVERVHRGDLRDSEALLTAQSVTLNALFVHLANLAAKTEYVDKFDKYLLLSLKAQGQCRATLETLAEIKNPPTLFAKQANVAHGPQQVNNAVSSLGRRANRTRAAKRKNSRKRTRRNSWATGPPNGGHGKPKRSGGGDRGNTPRAREQLTARHGPHGMLSRARTGVVSSSFSRPPDKFFGSTERFLKSSEPGSHS